MSTDYRSQLAAERIRPLLLVCAGMEDVANGLLPIAAEGVDPDDRAALTRKAREIAANSPALFQLKPEATAVGTAADATARRDELRRLGVL